MRIKNTGLIKKQNMNNRLISITFRIGVDVLGFPLYWKHIIHQYENKSKIGSVKKEQSIQELLKQH